jgi:hypothetical protein
MSEPTENRSSKNEGCLSGYHIAIVFINFLANFLYVFGSLALVSEIEVPMVILYLIGGLSIAVMGFSVVVWQWKKMGVYGLFTSTLIMLALNIYFGVALPILLTGGLVLLVLVLLVFPLWHHFK